jgi:hypothetical protein
VGRVGLVLTLVFSAGCMDDPRPPQTASASSAPKDAQHQGITTPHGDHSPHHGGLVLMNGELHYEVILSPEGRHQVWFSNAVREDLPASIARDVTMIVTRPKEPDEKVSLEIDDAGESWLARGRPITTGETMVKLSYTVQGQPHEIEVPFVAKGSSP